MAALSGREEIVSKTWEGSDDVRQRVGCRDQHFILSDNLLQCRRAGDHVNLDAKIPSPPEITVGVQLVVNGSVDLVLTLSELSELLRTWPGTEVG